VFDSAKDVPFDDESRIIIFSDCHRGDSSWTDEFAENQNLFYHALNYYDDRKFTYVEAGDGEDLWECKNFADTRRAYDHIYWRMSSFYEDERLYLIWGNHNSKWKNEKDRRKNLDKYFDERLSYEQWEPEVGALFKDAKDESRKKSEKKLFPGIEVYEGLRLRHRKRDLVIFITHGHQGSLFSDRLLWVGKNVVRHIWKLLLRWASPTHAHPA
jgi:hypothetical protein